MQKLPNTVPVIIKGKCWLGPYIQHNATPACPHRSCNHWTCVINLAVLNAFSSRNLEYPCKIKKNGRLYISARYLSFYSKVLGLQQKVWMTGGFFRSLWKLESKALDKTCSYKHCSLKIHVNWMNGASSMLLSDNVLDRNGDIWHYWRRAKR